ncbi:hypothetical protein [Zobellella denitrificans]
MNRNKALKGLIPSSFSVQTVSSPVVVECQAIDSDEGIPYTVFGPGIMVASASDVLRLATEQVDSVRFVIED